MNVSVGSGVSKTNTYENSFLGCASPLESKIISSSVGNAWNLWWLNADNSWIDHPEPSP